MKIMNSMLAIMILPLLLIGCAGQDYQDYSKSIKATNQANALLGASYFENQAKTNQAIMEKLSANGNETAIVLFGILQGQENIKAAAMFRSQAPEKPVTNGDIGKSIADNTVPTLIRWGAGAWLGNKVIDGLSNASNNLYQMSGDNNELNINSKNSATSSELTTGLNGDSSPINQYNGPVPVETAPEGEEFPGLPEGFVAPGCSVESRAEGRC